MRDAKDSASGSTKPTWATGVPASTSSSGSASYYRHEDANNNTNYSWFNIASGSGSGGSTASGSATSSTSSWTTSGSSIADVFNDAFDNWYSQASAGLYTFDSGPLDVENSDADGNLIGFGGQAGAPGEPFEAAQAPSGNQSVAASGLRIVTLWIRSVPVLQP